MCSALKIFSENSQQNLNHALSIRMYRPTGGNRDDTEVGEASWVRDNYGQLRPGYYDQDYRWQWSDISDDNSFDTSGQSLPKPNYAHSSGFGSQSQSYRGSGGSSFVSPGDYLIRNPNKEYPTYGDDRQYNDALPDYNPHLAPANANYPGYGTYPGYGNERREPYVSPYSPRPGPAEASYQQAIPQQAANRQGSIVTYTTKTGNEIYIDIDTFPAHIIYDPSREPLYFGIPVLLGPERKPRYYTVTGGLRDRWDHVVDANGNRIRNYKRDNLINTIITSTQVSANTTNALSTQQNQFQKYLNTYRVVQTKISALVLPFIRTITNATNNTLIYDVAMTAYVEIVGLPITFGGPFQGGINATIWLEKQYFNGTNHSLAAITALSTSERTKNDTAALNYFISYQSLLNVYHYAYHNGFKVANSTGMLDTLWTLQKYLMAKDTAIMSKAFTTTDTYSFRELFPHHIDKMAI